VSTAPAGDDRLQSVRAYYDRIAPRLRAVEGQNWHLQSRMALVLDPSGVTVTIYRARTVPWADVPRFEPGSNWMGGARIVTTGGVLRSRVPCSGMGLSAQRHFTADDRAYVAGRY
jgi:hypothetical protein